MSKAVDFLLVEDNPGDIRLTQEFFRDLKLANRLNVVNCCAEAIQFLRQQEPYTAAMLPDVILISIAILWQNTGNLINTIKEDAKLAHIPIVALTSFEGEEAGLHVDLPIDLSICKPLNMERVLSIIKRIEGLAITIAKSPEDSSD